MAPGDLSYLRQPRAGPEIQRPLDRLLSPGNIGDAWKTGHSGVSGELANEAYDMGINVMNYSFNQYTDLHPVKKKGVRS